jgi:hypothetical protein
MLTLSPQARAIASVVLGYALVAGYLTRLSLDVMLVVAHVHDLTDRSTNAGLAIVLVLVGVAIYLLAAGAARQVTDGWALWVAQAGQLVAAAGILISLIALIAAVAGRNGNGYLQFVP